MGKRPHNRVLVLGGMRDEDVEFSFIFDVHALKGIIDERSDIGSWLSDRRQGLKSGAVDYAETCLRGASQTLQVNDSVPVAIRRDHDSGWRLLGESAAVSVLLPSPVLVVVARIQKPHVGSPGEGHLQHVAA